MTDAPKPKLMYRPMLFSLLGDERLDKAQKAVGVALLLRSNALRGFVGHHPNWEKIALLTGYSLATVKKAFTSLSELGWFEPYERKDGSTGYRLTEERYARAVERHQEHKQLLKDRERSRKESVNAAHEAEQAA